MVLLTWENIVRFLPRRAKRSNVRHSDHSRNGSANEHALTNQCFWKETCFDGKSFPKPARVGVGSFLLGACQVQRQLIGHLSVLSRLKKNFAKVPV